MRDAATRWAHLGKLGTLFDWAATCHTTSTEHDIDAKVAGSANPPSVPSSAEDAAAPSSVADAATTTAASQHVANTDGGTVVKPATRSHIAGADRTMEGAEMAAASRRSLISGSATQRLAEPSRRRAEATRAATPATLGMPSWAWQDAQKASAPRAGAALPANGNNLPHQSGSGRRRPNMLRAEIQAAAAYGEARAKVRLQLRRRWGPVVADDDEDDHGSDDGEIRESMLVSLSTPALHQTCHRILDGVALEPPSPLVAHHVSTQTRMAQQAADGRATESRSTSHFSRGTAVAGTTIAGIRVPRVVPKPAARKPDPSTRAVERRLRTEVVKSASASTLSSSLTAARVRSAST